MRFINFTVEYNGDHYTYKMDSMVWDINGKAAWPKEVPAEVKQFRETVMGVLSEIDIDNNE